MFVHFFKFGGAPPQPFFLPEAKLVRQRRKETCVGDTCCVPPAQFEKLIVCNPQLVDNRGVGYRANSYSGGGYRTVAVIVGVAGKTGGGEGGETESVVPVPSAIQAHLGGVASHIYACGVEKAGMNR